MGLSLRTDVWRCTFWMWWDGQRLAADFGRAPAGIELYSHAGDIEASFSGFENENVAEANPDVVASMMNLAKAQWEKPKTLTKK